MRLIVTDNLAWLRAKPVSVIVLALVLLNSGGAQVSAQGGGTGKAAAEVNGQVITENLTEIRDL